MKPPPAKHASTARPGSLRQVFSAKKAGAVRIECPAAQVRTAAPARPAATVSDVYYFPPRGLALIALELNGLVDATGNVVDFVTPATEILSHSPHPAFAFLHGTFLDQFKQPEAVENLKPAETLITNLLNAGTEFWSQASWTGPRVIDVTVYVAWRDRTDLRWGHKIPKSYTARLTNIVAWLSGMALIVEAKNVGLADPSQPYEVRFTIVPVLEDGRGAAGGVPGGDQRASARHSGCASAGGAPTRSDLWPANRGGPGGFRGSRVSVWRGV